MDTGSFALQFVQQIVNGVSLGSIYALIALGYTMIYGIIKLINFAHGDIYMVGAYIGYVATSKFGLPFCLPSFWPCWAPLLLVSSLNGLPIAPCGTHPGLRP